LSLHHAGRGLVTGGLHSEYAECVAVHRERKGRKSCNSPAAVSTSTGTDRRTADGTTLTATAPVSIGTSIGSPLRSTMVVSTVGTPLIARTTRRGPVTVTLSGVYVPGP